MIIMLLNKYNYRFSKGFIHSRRDLSR